MHAKSKAKNIPNLSETSISSTDSLIKQNNFYFFFHFKKHYKEIENSNNILSSSFAKKNYLPRNQQMLDNPLDLKHAIYDSRFICQDLPVAVP